MENLHEDILTVNSLTKSFKLYSSPHDRVKEALHPFGKKYHKDFYALKNVSFSVKKGEILGIVGRNGSGKSTLLKIISGILQPTEGSFTLKGKVTPLLELGAGFNPMFTGLQNIYFLGSIMNQDQTDMQKIAEDVIEFAEIGDFIHQPVKNYSSGMRARLAFAISTAIKPEILILDEVLAVGDALFRRKAYARMETLIKGDTTVLFVSHSEQSILELCERVLFINQGEVVGLGPVKEVVHDYIKYTALETNKQEPFLAELRKKYSLSAEKKEKDAEIKKDNQVKKADVFEFIPGLKPKSTTVIKNSNVEITGIAVRKQNGEQVNRLQTGQSYYYEFTVHFHEDARNVSFGMPFKTENGKLLSGISPNHKINKLEKVQKGDVYYVRRDFTCHMLHGYYYTNAAVKQVVDGQRIDMIRIVDALVIQVIPRDEKDINGIVDLGQKITIRKAD